MADTIESSDVAGVHGFVALNPDGTAIGTPVGGATSDNQTNGTQKTQIVDAGGEAVTVTGGKLDVNASASLSGEAIPATGATTAVAVQIVDGSGNQIASFGGGTQYTEGTTDATITGTAALVEGAADALAVMTQPLTDTQLRATAVPVSGTVAVTGVATAANQTTVIGHLDGVETLLGTIDADTGTIATEVAGLLTDTELRATPVPVSGTFWQATQPVSIATAPVLVAGSAIIGKVGIDQTTPGTTNLVALTAETTKVIGTVRVASGGIASGAIASGAIASGAIASGAIASGAIAAGAIAAGATSIATTEDTASAAADHLVKVAQIRLDTPVAGANVSASGDYTQFIADSLGKTWTADNQVEDAAHTTGDRGSFMLAVRTDTAAASSGTTGDYEALHTDANGKLWANAEITAALPAGTNAIGKLAANSGVDIGDVDVASIAAGDNNIGNVDVVTLPALAAGSNAIGKLLPPDVDVSTHTNYARKYYTSAGAVTDGIIWSPAAGKRWHITTLKIQVSAAATVTIEDDLAAGDAVVDKYEFAANSGITLNFDKDYPLASAEDAADLLITTTAGNVYVLAVGYEI